MGISTQMKKLKVILKNIFHFKNKEGPSLWKTKPLIAGKLQKYSRHVWNGRGRLGSSTIKGWDPSIHPSNIKSFRRLSFILSCRKHKILKVILIQILIQIRGVVISE